MPKLKHAALSSVTPSVIRLFHLLLATNLLVSTMGVGVFEHLCQTRGYAASVMAPVKACCAKKAAKADHCQVSAVAKTNDAPVMSKAPCCQDQASWFQADFDGAQNTPILVASPAVSVWPVLAKAEIPAVPAVASLSLKVVQAMRYKPPCPDDDVRVRVQSFQI